MIAVFLHQKNKSQAWPEMLKHPMIITDLRFISLRATAGMLKSPRSEESLNKSEIKEYVMSVTVAAGLLRTGQYIHQIASAITVTGLVDYDSA